MKEFNYIYRLNAVSGYYKSKGYKYEGENWIEQKRNAVLTIELTKKNKVILFDLDDFFNSERKDSLGDEVLDLISDRYKDKKVKIYTDRYFFYHKKSFIYKNITVKPTSKSKASNLWD